MTTMNREAWLHAMADKMAPRFEELGFPLPEFRVAIGFTSGGMRSNACAEIWSNKASADGKFEILIRPDVKDSVTAAAHMAHELTHAAVGLKEGHKGNFVKVMAALGFVAPFTATGPTPAVEEWVEPFIKELGPIPHGSLRWTLGGVTMKRPPAKVAKGLRDGLDEKELEEIYTSAKPKQTTRLLKAQCQECGYTVRLAKKWIVDVGLPHCPVHGAMQADAEDDPEPTPQ